MLASLSVMANTAETSERYSNRRREYLKDYKSIYIYIYTQDTNFSMWFAFDWEIIYYFLFFNPFMKMEFQLPSSGGKLKINFSFSFGNRPEKVSAGSVVLSSLRHHVAIVWFGNPFRPGIGTSGTRVTYVPFVVVASSHVGQQRQSVRHVCTGRHIASSKTWTGYALGGIT